jgi:hypothetical protein
MKKFIVLSFVALLVLAFGTMAFAQAKPEELKLDFRASGFIDVQSTWGQNITEGNAGAGLYNTVSSTYRPGGVGYDDTVSWMATRARLKFDAVMGKNLSGTIFFEMDSSRWGERGDGRNALGVWSGDRAALEIKNVYIDFAVPGIPVPISVRAGLQPLALRPNMLIYTDGMGITGNIKVDPANIQLIWFKAIENKIYAADDVDIYGLHANAKVGPVTVGGYGINYNMNTYPFPAAAGEDVHFQGNFWWLGVYADGKLGPVNLNFDFIYDRGTVEDRPHPQFRDVKYRGWATRLKIDYPWEKINFGFVGMYASGSDTHKTSSSGTPDPGVTKVGGYVMPPGSEAFAIFTESIVFYGTGFNQTSSGIAIAGNYTSVSRGTIGGTWMGKLYGSFKATPWYKVTLQGLYIGDTTKHGNTVGTARKADGTLQDDKSIGWEVNLINEIQIYKNLKYSLGIGALFPGDGLRYYESAANPDDKPKTPWAVIGNLTYSF